jgi:small subunit ribosomal protein S16
MAVRIRLRRVGRKKQPYYRVVVMPSTAPRDGAYIDEVGFYNPRTRPAFLTMDLAKVDAWLEKGAEATEAAASLIRKARKGGDDAVRFVQPGEEAPVMKTATKPERRPRAKAAEGADQAPPVEEPTDPMEGAAPDAEQEPPAEAVEGATKDAVEDLAPDEAPEAATAEAGAEAPEAEAPEAVAEAEEPAAQAEAGEPAAQAEAEEPAAQAEAEEPAAEAEAEEPAAEAEAEEPAAEAEAEEPAAEAEEADEADAPKSKSKSPEQ